MAAYQQLDAGSIYLINVTKCLAKAKHKSPVLASLGFVFGLFFKLLFMSFCDVE